MSSRASDAIRLELPGRLWADRACDALSLLAIGTVGWVAIRHGSALWSCALATLTAAALCVARWRAPCGAPAFVTAGARTRRLGPGLVVEGPGHRPGRSAGLAWLTRWDLPEDALRRLTVRLRATRPKAGS